MLGAWCYGGFVGQKAFVCIVYMQRAESDEYCLSLDSEVTLSKQALE